MEFKGTKGGWRVDINVSSQNIENRNIVQINGGKTICSIVRFDPYEVPDEIQEANAKLIASAPEMFEMLKRGDATSFENMKTEVNKLLKKITE